MKCHWLYNYYQYKPFWIWAIHNNKRKYFIIYFILHKHKRRNEGILYEAPNTRNRINDEVREQLAAGTETFLTDTQGLKLAYESPDRIYRNGSQIYIAGTKDPFDICDDLKLPFYRNKKHEEIQRRW